MNNTYIEHNIEVLSNIINNCTDCNIRTLATILLDIQQLLVNINKSIGNIEYAKVNA